ncbi:MAG: sulfotransferase family protein [Paracoccus hibiscisoli]|uniref:sulfotransferase family protein n=1 Tax=Paracoccus hibiscisoli TaxID=2023261 RepID=UPI00391A1830
MMTEQPHTDRPGKVAVVVLGMHRSGTSSLAGMLDGLGCRGPATLMPASDTNAAGYYESLPVFRLNDAILTALGSRWDDWRPLRPDVHLSPRLAEFHDKARAVVAAEYGDGSLIYLKDPRISLLLPFWRGVLRDAGYRCVYLHTHRSPSEIGASLQRRDDIDPGLSLLAWLSQVLQAERHSRGEVRHFTSYEALLRDPAAVAAASEAAFGFPWPRPAEVGAGRVNRALRHHDAGAQAVLEDSRVPGLIRQTLEILERWAAMGEQADDHARLDDIARAFDEAEGLFAGAMQALRARSAQLAPARAREETLKTEKAALETRLTQATKDKAMLDEHLTQITQARDEAVRDRDAARQAQAEAEARQARQLQELDMLTDRLIDRDAALAAIRRDTLAMTNRATQLEQQNARLKAEQQQRSAGAEATRQQLDQTRKEVEALRRQLDDQRQEFLSSTSWRVSAPVRVLGRLVRRR